jgi:hypothetical protein
VPAAQVRRRHGQRHRAQQLVRAGGRVAPPTDELVQRVDVEVQGAGVPVRDQGCQRGLPDPRGTVEVEEARHPPDATGGVR